MLEAALDLGMGNGIAEKTKEERRAEPVTWGELSDVLWTALLFAKIDFGIHLAQIVDESITND